MWIRFRMSWVILIVFGILMLSACTSEVQNNDEVLKENQKKAEKYVETANKDMNDEKAQYEAGIALYNANKLEESTDYYKRAININDKNPDYHNNLGNIYRDQKEYQKAVEEYRKAVRLNRKYIYGYTNLAMTQYMFLKDKKSAIETLDEGLKHNLNNSQLLDLKNSYSK